MGSAALYLFVSCILFLLTSVALAQSPATDKQPVFWTAAIAFLCGAGSIIAFVIWLYNMAVK